MKRIGLPSLKTQYSMSATSLSSSIINLLKYFEERNFHAAGKVVIQVPVSVFETNFTNEFKAICIAVEGDNAGLVEFPEIIVVGREVAVNVDFIRANANGIAELEAATVAVEEINFGDSAFLNETFDVVKFAEVDNFIGASVIEIFRVGILSGGVVVIPFAENNFVDEGNGLENFFKVLVEDVRRGVRLNADPSFTAVFMQMF